MCTAVCSFSRGWEILVKSCAQGAFVKETAKIISGLFTLIVATAAAVSKFGAVSAWVTVLELPGAANYFIQGKAAKGSVIETASAVGIIVISLIGAGKAIDTLFACMGWVSKALGAIPLIGATIAATPFLMVISIIAVPVSILNIAASITHIMRQDNFSMLAGNQNLDPWKAERKEYLVKIAVDVAKLVGAIFAIVGIAASASALTVLGTVATIVASVLAISRVIMTQDRILPVRV